MKIKMIMIGKNKIAEIISDKVIIKNFQDALDVMMIIPSDHIVFHEDNFEKDFFDLSTRIAGEILQKFTNYHIKLAIIGNFDKYKSKSLQAFIYESNKNGDYLFVKSMKEVIKIWQEKF
jgi:hypothetical protein